MNHAYAADIIAELQAAGPLEQAGGRLLSKSFVCESTAISITQSADGPV